jgi:N-acetylglucosaminyldiphosphoundecaprenol N-acetyl-beta-D-mannosaminyltransferase
MERIKFLDSIIDNISLEEAVGYVDSFVISGRPHQIVAINAAKIVKMQHDRRLADIINSCSLIFPDGKAVVWAARFLGNPLKQRVAGIDLMQEVVKLAFDKKYRLYFLGAREDVVRKVVNIYKTEFPGIDIVGWHNGYFKTSLREGEVIEEIKRLKPQILFVAMGSPLKEYWIEKNFEYLGVPVCMGVGGSFDVVGGFTKRAPGWIQDVGLEWFFRFLNEPRRLWKRYLYTNAAFIWLLLKQKLSLHFNH